jgi:ABC-type transporter Mla subunit MlaD
MSYQNIIYAAMAPAAIDRLIETANDLAAEVRQFADDAETAGSLTLAKSLRAMADHYDTARLAVEEPSLTNHPAAVTDAERRAEGWLASL